jgi:hypothetical protein
LLSTLVLVTSGCDEFPGIDAIEFSGAREAKSRL